MNAVMLLVALSQLLFSLVAGMYFYQNLKSQNSGKSAIDLDSRKEMEKLKKLRSVHLTKPLSEATRPDTLEEIVGQEQGIKALRAALCSPNPQHVLIYGPPGIGKTAAARLILEEAKKTEGSPFQASAKFVELDATTLRFDERSIADPLIGSVHDPIYQGAGAYGPAGVPQPKAGAVTDAHGGVLFIDEIGELHPLQMNKLLKVLEDRVVYLTSSYYSSENGSIPKFIHDIFKNGFPADFRLVGATTRRPEEIPPALRSRCTEIYFEGLKAGQVERIAKNAAVKAGFPCGKEATEIVSKYASNGREAVNIVQTAIAVATMEKRKEIMARDVEWVISAGRYSPRLMPKIGSVGKIGVVNGLAVYNGDNGALLTIEATAEPAVQKGSGEIKVTGIVEEEEIKSATGHMKRNSCARASVNNVITVFEEMTGISAKDYNIHINFPGGLPVDGPSAGIAMFCAVYSAVFKMTVSPCIAMTGEISLQGNVLPVGGVSFKVEAAKEAGAKKVLIPKDNWQRAFENSTMPIVCVSTIEDVIGQVFGKIEEKAEPEKKSIDLTKNVGVLTAEGNI